MATQPEDVAPVVEAHETSESENQTTDSDVVSEDKSPRSNVSHDSAGGRGNGGGDASGSGGANAPASSGASNNLLMCFDMDDYRITEKDLFDFMEKATPDECLHLASNIEDVMMEWMARLKTLKSHNKEALKEEKVKARKLKQKELALVKKEEGKAIRETVIDVNVKYQTRIVTIQTRNDTTAGELMNRILQQFHFAKKTKKSMILRDAKDENLSQHPRRTLFAFGVKNGDTLTVSLSLTGGASKRTRITEDKFKTKAERVAQVENDTKLFLLQLNSLVLPDLLSAKASIANIHNSLNDKSLTDAMKDLDIQDLKSLKFNIDNCGNDEKVKVGHITNAIAKNITTPIETADFFIKCLKDNATSLTFLALVRGFAKHHGRVSWEQFKSFVDDLIEEKAEERGKVKAQQDDSML